MSLASLITRNTFSTLFVLSSGAYSQSAPPVSCCDLVKPVAGASQHAHLYHSTLSYICHYLLKGRHGWNSFPGSTFWRNFKCDLNNFFLHPRVFAPKCASCNQPILPAQVRVNMHRFFTENSCWHKNTFQELFLLLAECMWDIKYSSAVMSLLNIPRGCNSHSAYVAYYFVSLGCFPGLNYAVMNLV